MDTGMSFSRFSRAFVCFKCVVSTDGGNSCMTDVCMYVRWWLQMCESIYIEDMCRLCDGRLHDIDEIFYSYFCM